MRTSVPKLEELHPPLSNALQKQNEITVSKSKIESEIRAIRSEGVYNSGIGSNNVNNRVKVILGEIPDPPVDSNSRRLGELLVELDAHNKAEGHIYEIIQKERYAASKLVCAKVSDQHKTLGKKFAEAVIALHKAHIDYLAFLDDVESTGASITPLNPVWPTYLGHPKDPSGSYYYLAQDFFEHGFISKRDPLGLVH